MKVVVFLHSKTKENLRWFQCPCRQNKPSCFSYMLCALKVTSAENCFRLFDWSTFCTRSEISWNSSKRCLWSVFFFFHGLFSLGWHGSSYRKSRFRLGSLLISIVVFQNSFVGAVWWWLLFHTYWVLSAKIIGTWFVLILTLTNLQHERPNFTVMNERTYGCVTW